MPSNSPKNGGDHVAAAREARFRAARLGDTARRLLKNAAVQKLVADQRVAAQAKSGVTLERVLREYGRLAFSHIRRACRWVNGHGALELIPSDQIDDDTAAAIAEARGVTLRGGHIDRKIRFHAKTAALEALGRHLGMFDRFDRDKRQEAAQSTAEALELALQRIAERRLLEQAADARLAVPVLANGKVEDDAKLE